MINVKMEKEEKLSPSKATSELKCQALMENHSYAFNSGLDEVRAGFTKDLTDFGLFLSLVHKELLKKREMATETLLPEAGSSYRAKTYIKGQNFMLQRHIRRLERYDREIARRVESLSTSLEPAILPASMTSPVSEIDDVDGNPDAIREAPVDCDSSSLDRSSSTCSSPDSSLSSSTANSSLSSDPARKTVNQLHADMVKMKRRCKRILDVSDQYLANVSTSEDPTLEKVPPKSPEQSAQEAQTIEGYKSFKMAAESLGEHLMVLVKSYTKKHSKRPSQ